MKQITIATIKDALSMLSIKDTNSIQMLKGVTIKEHGGSIVTKWNGKAVISCGIKIKARTHKADCIAIMDAVIESIGQDRWDEIIKVITQDESDEQTSEQETIEEAQEAQEATNDTISEEQQETIESDEDTSYSVLTDIGIISQYRDTHIESLEDAESIAKEYVAQGYDVEIRDDETGETIKLYTKEEDKIMKKPTMSKSKAIMEIACLTSSTLARICGSTNYSVIDDCSRKLISQIESMSEDAFDGCETWLDVLDRIGKTLGDKVDSWYILGNMDARENHIKYGLDDARRILKDYIETITIEGIENRQEERDYIRGACDALCIDMDSIMLQMSEQHETSEDEQHPMTYKEYMQEHDKEHLSWCKPMMSDDGQYGIIMTDAKPSVIILDGETMDATDESVKKLAHAVTDEDDYDMFATLGGWSDIEIVMQSDKLHECGCSFCPMIHECEAMSETIEEIC